MIRVFFKSGTNNQCAGFVFGRGLFVFFCMIILLVPRGFSAVGDKEQKKKSPTLVLESANSNENTYVNGEFISVLKGNVTFSYDDIKIRSDEATWWRNQGIVKFVRNVKVARGAQTLTCDKMHFTKDGNLLTALGHFVFIDTAESAKLTGETGEYHVDSRTFTLRGNPRLTRFDTTSAETLTISGDVMTYVDSLKRASVSDKVVIKKGKLTSHCKAADYFTEKNQAHLRINPEIQYDVHRITGDSIDLQFGKESLKNAYVLGHSHGVYIDTSEISKNKDTAYTHIWGDSLFMTVSDSGVMDSLWTYGKALTRYFLSSSPEIANEAAGKRMLMNFTHDGNVNDVRIWGNARSKYYVDEDNGKGANEASGDSIRVVFRKGKASFLSLSGKARGVYYPRNL